MVRAMDLQDNFSKTQAVERINQIIRQQPDADQRAFAQEMQKRAMEEKETTEPMEDQHQIDTSPEKKEFRQKKELDTALRKKRKQKNAGDEKPPKAGDHIIDITV